VCEAGAQKFHLNYFICNCAAALYQKILELAQGIGQQAPGRNAGSGGYGRGGNGINSDEGIAQKGEGLLTMLAELDITQQSYSQGLQALLMDVSLVPRVLFMVARAPCTTCLEQEGHCLPG
jgi:hypothetical protein